VNRDMVELSRFAAVLNQEIYGMFNKTNSYWRSGTYNMLEY
jgi:hypothetical protein